MFQDILRESSIYQEIVEQERQQGLQRQRQTLVGFVQRHFPDLEALAKQQVDGITDPEVLQTVILKLLDAQTVEEARQILLGVDQSESPSAREDRQNGDQSQTSQGWLE
jgi:hypothetical protein